MKRIVLSILVASGCFFSSNSMMRFAVGRITHAVRGLHDLKAAHLELQLISLAKDVAALKEGVAALKEKEWLKYVSEEMQQEKLSKYKEKQERENAVYKAWQEACKNSR